MSEETRIVNGRVYKVTNLPPGEEVPLSRREWSLLRVPDDAPDLPLPTGSTSEDTYYDDEEEG